MTYSNRFFTGINKQTVKFSYNAGIFDPEQYNFGTQHTNYVLIRDILAKYDLKLSKVGVQHNLKEATASDPYPIKGSMAVEFTAFIDGKKNHPLLIWKKDGNAKGNNLNRVFTSGECFNISTFTRLPKSKLDEIFASMALKAWVMSDISDE